MKKKLFSLIVLAFILILSSITSFLLINSNHKKVYLSKNTGDFINNLDKELPDWMKCYNVPGAAIAIIENDKIIFQKGYGYSNKESNTITTPETIFRIASISKPITAFGIMHLVDQGKIKLDDPAEKHLTRWHIPESNFDSNGVTIRRLLSHTAGFSVEGSPGYDPNNALPTIEQSLSGIAGEDWQVKLINEPGTTFKYSGGGFSILQLIVEEVTGKSFSEYMQTEIFTPLNLNSTRYDKNFQDISLIATPYTGKDKPLIDKPWVEFASGGIYTNLKDLSNFVVSCMEDYNGNLPGRNVLKPTTINEMFTPQPNTQSSFGVYGLGFIPETLKSGDKLISHSGDITGWNAQIAFLPEKKSGIVILTNSDAGYYFKSDVLGAWTSWSTSSINSDTKFLRLMQKALLTIAFFLEVLSLYYLYKITEEFVKKKRFFSFNFIKRFNFKYTIRTFLPLILILAWYLIFYSEYIFKIFFKLDDYLLFTFFPPEFFWITLIITILGNVLTLLNLFTEKKQSI
ncbi:MAG: serine hydrolase domain-containing protein [Clostridiaceae bacterium]